MQRRNFISNLAVILPAGMVAPKLLFENNTITGNLIKTEVLVLGAGNAGLFIAQQLRKEKIETVLLEPGNGTSQSAVYNHHAQPGIIRQYGKNEKAKIETIAAGHFDEVSEAVTAGFMPTEIRKTAEGYFITDGTTTYSAKKLVLALPVEIDLAAATIKVKANEDSSVAISCKRKNQRNPATVRTISAAKIDEAAVLQFAREKSQGLLAVL
jgi:2-polyprenyl-6-methoxyphenol hydroxylase-like FAD-dependent oxidoreductase